MKPPAVRMNARRPNRHGRMLGRVVGVAAVGGLLAFLASQFLNFDFRVGWKDATTPLAEQIGEKSEDAANAAASAMDEGVDSVQRLISDPTPAPGPDTKYVGISVADVMIDGDQYKLLVVDRPAGSATTSGSEVDEGRRPVALYEVVRLAKELPGEKNGIKVRIRRTALATAEAERELLAALYTAQIPDDQIDFRERLVE